MTEYRIRFNGEDWVVSIYRSGELISVNDFANPKQACAFIDAHHSF